MGREQIKTLVQKFGGSSVGDLDKIRFVAAKIKQSHDAGDRVVVVVSAMQGETDRLVAMAHKLSVIPAPRELDVLLATGEQVTIALLSIALMELGCQARSYIGSQVQIITDNAHNKARIVKIDNDKINADLDAGKIVVIAGFQGVDEHGNVTTLGRGGSDTTAVAIAAALNADECQIYTDVDGVYTADPRLVPNARRMERITFEEMLELASLGAKVLQIRAVELAGRYSVPLRVLSTFHPGAGTLISYEDKSMEQHEIAGVAYNKHEARIMLRGVPEQPGYISKILEPISDAHIEVDMIVQNVAINGLTDFTFTVHRRDFAKTMSIISPLADSLNVAEVLTDDKIAKLSLVGVGMRSHAGVASKMFKALGDIGVNIQLISTSEIKVSVILDEKYIELGVRTLHEAFGLDKEPLQED
jgi:aspartate kinase